MPLSTTIAVGSLSKLSVRALEIPIGIHELTIAFEDGDHVYTSPDLELGVIKLLNDRPLMGRLTFHYSYNDADRMITLYDTDYPSKDGMALVTMPKDMEEHTNVKHAAPSAETVADDMDPESLWNMHSELVPGAADALKRIAQTANQTLISSLEDEPGVTVRVRALPHGVSASEHLELRRVYKDRIPLSAYNSGFVQSTFKVGDTIETAGLGSTLGGKATFPFYQHFANVIGSTDDPKIDGMDWYPLWKQEYGVSLSKCTSWNYNGFQCTPGADLKGGHVIKGDDSDDVLPGSDNVYIMPICAKHNSDDHVYMAAKTNRRAVWLKNYKGK